MVKSILEYSLTLTLYINVMFVNQVALLITVFRKIHYGTIHGLTSMKILVLEIAIKNIVKSYAVKGIMVKFVLVNLQFKVIKDRNNIDGVNINVVFRDEHVEDIERFICLIKEGT